jgi:hypothetical protein
MRVPRPHEIYVEADEQDVNLGRAVFWNVKR